MRRHTRVMAVSAVLAIAASGCGGDGAGPQSAAPLAEMLATGVDIDYEPLASPEEAVAKADLAVVGTLTDVAPGMAVAAGTQAEAARRAGSWVTLVIDVADVLVGPESAVVAGRVWVQVPSSPATSVDALARANPGAEVVAVLDDLTGWAPHPGAAVARPADVPDAAPLFAAYADGLWLQGDADPSMVGIGVEPAELSTGWGGPATVAEVATAISGAAAD